MKRSASTDKMLTARLKNYVGVSPQNFISQSQMVASCTGNALMEVFAVVPFTNCQSQMIASCTENFDSLYLHILKSLVEPGSPIPKLPSQKVLCYLSVGGYQHKFRNFKDLVLYYSGHKFWNETKYWWNESRNVRLWKRKRTNCDKKSVTIDTKLNTHILYINLKKI